jgi:hypothetical protein
MIRFNKAPVPASTDLSFRRDLIIPEQPQVAKYGDLVADRIRRLDEYAAALGRGFGLPFTPGIELDEGMRASHQAPADAVAVLGLVFSSSKLVSLERRKGQWGLYYASRPSMVLANREHTTVVPLKDAPLDVREAFLLRAEEFFHAYLATCENRLGSMKQAVESGDRALALLERLQLR